MTSTHARSRGSLSYSRSTGGLAAEHEFRTRFYRRIRRVRLQAQERDQDICRPHRAFRDFRTGASLKRICPEFKFNK
jgi:hypothetical protein